MAIPVPAAGPRRRIRSVAEAGDAGIVPADEELVARCRAGSEAAFAAIVDRYGPALRRHCAHIVDRAAAEDAAQEAFVAAWVALRDGTEVRALRPWLFTIARRKALTARARNPYAVELSESLPGARSCAEEAAGATRAREVLAAVAALPGAQRDALIGSALHERSGTQLARQLGVPEPTVRQLVFRARERLRTTGLAVLAPPLALARLLRRASGAAGRMTTAGPGPVAAATAVKVGVVVVVAASAGGAAAGGAFDAAHHHRGRTSLVRAVSLPRASGGPAVVPHARAPARHAASAVRAGRRGAAEHRRHPAGGSSSAARRRGRVAEGRGAAVAPASATAAASGSPPTAIRSTTATTGRVSTPDTIAPPANEGASSKAATPERTAASAEGAATNAAAPAAGAVGGTTRSVTGTVAQTAGQAVDGAGQVVQGAGQAVQGVGQAVTGAGQAVTGVGQAIQGAGQAGAGAGAVAQGAGQAVQGAGQAVQGAGQAVQGAGQAVQGAGQAVQGAGQAVQGAGQAVQGAGQQIGSGAAGILHGVGATGATGPLGIG